jgi:hypothetical protein
MGRLFGCDVFDRPVAELRQIDAGERDSPLPSSTGDTNR